MANTITRRRDIGRVLITTTLPLDLVSQRMTRGIGDRADGITMIHSSAVHTIPLCIPAILIGNHMELILIPVTVIARRTLPEAEGDAGTVRREPLEQREAVVWYEEAEEMRVALEAAPRAQLICRQGTKHLQVLVTIHRQQHLHQECQRGGRAVMLLVAEREPIPAVEVAIRVQEARKAAEVRSREHTHRRPRRMAPIGVGPVVHIHRRRQLRHSKAHRQVMPEDPCRVVDHAEGEVDRCWKKHSAR